MYNSVNFIYPQQEARDKTQQNDLYMHKIPQISLAEEACS